MRLRLAHTLMLVVVVSLLMQGTAFAAPFLRYVTNNWLDSVHLTAIQDGMNGPQSGQYPVVVSDGNGNMLILFRSETGTVIADSTYNIWFSRRTDGVYTTAEPITALQDEYDGGSYSGISYFNAAALPDGNVIVVAYAKDNATSTGEGFSYSIWDKDTLSWSAYEHVFGTTNNFVSDGKINIVTTADGAAVIFSSDDADEGKIQWITYDAGADTWSSVNTSETLISMETDDYYIQPVVDAVSGTIYVTYVDQNGALFAGALFDDGTSSAEWTVSLEVSSYYDDSAVKHIAAFPDGGFIVVFQNDNDGLYYYAIGDESGTSSPTLIPGLDSGGGFPVVGVDSQGRVAVAAMDSNDNTQIVTTDGRPDTGGSWSAPIALQNGTDAQGIGEPIVTFSVTPAGNLVVSYFSKLLPSNNHSVAMRALLDDGWSEAYLIDETSTDGPTAYYTMFAVDNQGRPTVAWTSTPDFLDGAIQGVYAANYFDSIVPSVTPENEDTVRIVPQCLTMPDIEVVQLTPLSAGGTADLRVTMRNQHNEHQGVSDILLSLSDGITVSSASANVVNLGQRAALQGLVTAPNSKVSFDVTVTAAADAAPAPIFVAEVYCGGRALGSVSGPFGGTIADVATAVAAAPAETPAPVAPAEPAAPPALPVTLPNTGTSLAFAGWLLAAGVSSLSAGLFLRRRN